MTAEELETEIKNPECLKDQSLPNEIEAIFEYLSFNDKIVFKSQQIDDPELERSEKKQIAKEVFGKNRQTFLQRFGVYFEEQHLNAFGRFAMEATWKEQENGDEIQDMLLNYHTRLNTRKCDIKNRRYTAMQNLIKEGEYFSELEMMKRAPELYQELVGQYLSEEEIKKRDSYDVKKTTFSGILMHQLEQQQKDEILQQVNQKDDEVTNETIKQTSNNKRKITSFEEEVDSDEDTEMLANKEEEELQNNDEFEIPKACQQQWGNFDNETVVCSSTSSNVKKNKNSLNKNKKSTEVYITAGERALLRQEFVDLMHEQFLAGKDENFDYAEVDDNTQLDDLIQINQDKEDAYFASSDDEDEETTNHNQLTEITHNSESEDELDRYMRHLSQHHSLKS